MNLFNKFSVNIYPLCYPLRTFATGGKNRQVAKTIVRLIWELEVNMHSFLKTFSAVRILLQNQYRMT